MFKKNLLLVLVCCLLPQLSFAQEREEMDVMAAGDSAFRSWRMSLFNITSLENMTYNREATGQRSYSTYTYLSFNKKINEDQRFSIRVPFTFNTSGQNKYGDHQSSEFNLQDLHVSYALYDLGYIGDVDIAGNFKVYLPTGEFSRKSGMVAKFRFETFFDYAFGNYSYISYGVKPDFYWQSRTANFNFDSNVNPNTGFYYSDPRQTNKLFEVDHYLEVVFDINKYLAFKPRIGFEETWYYSSAVEDLEGRHNTKGYYQISFNIRPTRGWSFLVGMTNTTVLTPSKGREVFIGQPENTQYFVMTNGSLF